jgi:hypothetical protein
MSTTFKEEWQIKEQTEWVSRIVFPNGAHAVISRFESETGRLVMSEEEMKKTAKLIVCAPQLLECLQEAVKHLEETDFDVCGTPDTMMNKFKQLIQKATT